MPFHVNLTRASWRRDAIGVRERRLRCAPAPERTGDELDPAPFVGDA